MAALRAFAVKLHDKGDGHGVDWALVSATLFRVGFSCLREIPSGDARMQTVARRAHDAAYSLMTDTPDSGTPYTLTQPERPPFDPEVAAHIDMDLGR